MDFELSEDQRAIAEMANGLMRDYCTDERLREWHLSGEPYMHDLWACCVETGLHALAIPEASGGSGLGMTELMVLLEAQGQGLGQVPLWRHQLAAAVLATFAEPALTPWVEQAASGSGLLSLSLEALSATHGIELRARREADGWRLDGRVAALALAEQSAAALVVADVEGQPRLVLLDLSSPGISRVPGVMTHGEALADLHLASVTLRAHQVLPQAALDWLEPRAIAALAALQLGVSAEQIRRTVAYVSERQQFDRSIGSFQAVQMSMADTHVALEVLRGALWQLIFRLDAGLAAPCEALATAYLACEAGHRIGHVAQHVHGGIGVDLTYPIHRFLYWSRALGSALGGSSASLERLGEWLSDNDTLGWKYDLQEHQAL